MTRYRIIITPTAIEDLAAQVEYIRSDSARAAQRWYDDCIEAIDSLALLPRSGRIAPESEWFEREIRQIVVHSHRVLYVIEEKVVRVLHVRNAARKPFRRGDSE